MTLPLLECASWRHPRDFKQVELYGCGWTNDQLADVMDGWAWIGDVESLQLGLEIRTCRRLTVTIEHGVAGADDIYVVSPIDTRYGSGRPLKRDLSRPNS